MLSPMLARSSLHRTSRCLSLPLCASVSVSVFHLSRHKIAAYQKKTLSLHVSMLAEFTLLCVDIASLVDGNSRSTQVDVINETTLSLTFVVVIIFACVYVWFVVKELCV
eukprot:m.123647 g.123647  ORF g.123647 m.123647 type:complete len:109 (-) comp29004_c0_seq4:2349-2675(-)